MAVVKQMFTEVETQVRAMDAFRNMQTQMLDCLSKFRNAVDAKKGEQPQCLLFYPAIAMAPGVMPNAGPPSP